MNQTTWKSLICCIVQFFPASAAGPRERSRWCNEVEQKLLAVGCDRERADDLLDGRESPSRIDARIPGRIDQLVFAVNCFGFFASSSGLVPTRFAGRDPENDLLIAWRGRELPRKPLLSTSGVIVAPEIEARSHLISLSKFEHG